MITKEEMQAIATRVKANSAKLKDCAGHRFALPPAAIEAVMFSRVKVPCSVCGGEMELHEATLFMEGVLAHERDASLADSARAFEAVLNEAWAQRKAAKK